jgi:predicted nucleic acid-binding protein
MIYLDTSALKRPFDDMKDARMSLEADAVLVVLESIESGALTMAGSAVLDFENKRNPLNLRREWADRVLRRASIRQEVNEVVAERGFELVRGGMAPIDALHVACAEACNCSVLLTCDDRLQKKSGLARVTLMNPVTYVVSGMRS